MDAANNAERVQAQAECIAGALYYRATTRAKVEADLLERGYARERVDQIMALVDEMLRDLRR